MKRIEISQIVTQLQRDKLFDKTHDIQRDYPIIFRHVWDYYRHHVDSSHSMVYRKLVMNIISENFLLLKRIEDEKNAVQVVYRVHGSYYAF